MQTYANTEQLPPAKAINRGGAGQLQKQTRHVVNMLLWGPLLLLVVVERVARGLYGLAHMQVMSSANDICCQDSELFQVDAWDVFRAPVVISKHERFGIASGVTICTPLQEWGMAALHRRGVSKLDT